MERTRFVDENYAKWKFTQMRYIALYLLNLIFYILFYYYIYIAPVRKRKIMIYINILQ